MIRKILLLCFSVVMVFQSMAQDSLQARIILIGDGGQLASDGSHPVVEMVKKYIPMDKKTTVVYLGDNLYKVGLPDNSLPTYEIAKAPLDSQIHIAGENKDVKVYFVPGNHDWANGRSNGYESILRVQSYIDFLGNESIKMFPRDGCPGPVDVEVTDDITLIMMDSQWWIHENEKPGIESDCPAKTREEVLTELEDILQKNSNKLILFAFHHPFKSYGPHGGYFTIKQHIFPLTDIRPNLYIPLPVLGSVYPLTRAVFGTIQDLKHPLYQEMINTIGEVVKTHPNVIFLSGHEHTQQLITDSNYNYVVSGSGSKYNRVSKGKNSKFASDKMGFATLEISKNKNVRINFYNGEADSLENMYSENILDFSIVPTDAKDTLRDVVYEFKDSAVISASDQFKEWTGLKRLFLGNNYRKLWNTPIELKEFNIKKEQGGFTAEEMGGGKQSRTLIMNDKNGKEWALRTVDKDPVKAVPAHLRGTVAQDIVADMVSASHPYAPFVIPTLSKAVDVPAAQPKYFFVPNDYALGYYRPWFANIVAMLEDRDPVPDNDTKSTSKIINKLLEDNDDRIDQDAVLRARLLDMLIADWDRHDGQWKWAAKDTGKGKVYYPVPRDRDQAFFKSDGLLVSLVRRQMPFLGGFRPETKKFKGLNFVARDFDRFFLNKIDEDKWKSIADTFVMNMTDDVIKEAASKYPPEIKALDSAHIVNTLIARREFLAEKSLEYYKFISKEVSVIGSNESEYFYLKNDDNGQLNLSVYKKKEESDSVSLMYRRSFDPVYTKELRLYGLNGDDKFEVDDNAASKIEIRFVGGKGVDTFDIKGGVKNWVYDLQYENNVLVNTSRTNKELHNYPEVNEYKTTGYKYNSNSFPQLNMGFNQEDGLLVGMGFHARRHGFRKDPYATDHRFSTLFAPFNERAYQLRYRSELNKILFKNDLVVNAQMVSPTLNNFFGFGNTTVFDKELTRRYYRVRHSFIEADVLLRKRLNNIFSLSVGPSYYRYWNHYKNNIGKILEDPIFIGTDSASLFQSKHYMGLKARFDINFIDNELFPTRGITWNTELLANKGLNDHSEGVTRLTTDMSIYASVSDESRLRAIFRFGGGKIFNDNFEYFQAVSLGAQNYLRGYRKNRFTGKSMMYGSAELRLKLFQSKSYMLPGEVGLVGFYDLGRVWMEGENSRKWHPGYGGGLYFVPFNTMLLSFVAGFSPEDKTFNATLGTKINLTF